MQRGELSIAFIVFAAALSVSPALAADEPEGVPAETTTASAPLPETSEAAKSNYNNKLVCHSQTVVGSRIPRTICATKSQVDARRKADQAWKQTLDMERDRLPPPGGGVVGG